MSLEEVVDRLRKKILGFRDREELIVEENTKGALIEPLLSALGWDVQELDEVHREYKRKSKDKPVDYALFLNREPRLFIEAKGLDQDLTNRKWASQIMGYAATAGVKWCVLTDGDEYRLLNASAEVDVDEKLFRTIRISISDQDHDRTLQTLALLSKEKLAERLPAGGQENLLNVLWNAHFVDRKVKGAVEALFRNEDPGLLRLLRKNTSGLKPNEIRASLKRAVPVRIDFPEVPVGAYPAAAPQKPIHERLRVRRRKTPLLAVVDKTKQKTPLSFETKLSDLIQAGLCQPPLQLEREYKGVHLKATIQNDGTVSVGGELYDSLSTAGGMARKSVIGAPAGRLYPQTNGWTFWKFRDAETGKLIEIDVLRQKHLKRRQPDFAKAQVQGFFLGRPMPVSEATGFSYPENGADPVALVS